MGRSTSTSASRSDLFIAVLVGTLVFLMAARTPLDSDLFWHLRAGEQTLQTLRPVLSDTMSYTRAGAAWINHSWLSQVLLALLYRAGGFLGLGAWVAALATATMLAVYWRMAGPPLWRAFLIVLACLVAAPVWSPRPQLVSLLALVVLDWLLEAWKDKKASGGWIVLLFAAWSNLHGGYPLGLILIGCWMGGELTNHLMGREERLPMRRIWTLGGWALAGWAATAINPNGLATWKIPFQTVGVGALQQAIPEWASPDFHDLVQQPFLWMLAGLLAAFGLAGEPVEGKALFKVIVFGAMGLAARRNFGPFALLAAPVLAASGWKVLSRAAGRIPKRSAAQRQLPAGVQRAFNLAIVAFLAFAALVKLVVVTQPALVGASLRQSFPVEAAAWLEEQKPAGRLFSTYAWGGYLDWQLSAYPVFVDGRTDLFGDEIIREWQSVLAIRPGWKEILDRWQVRLVLVEPGQPLLSELERNGWKELYRDPTAALYGR